MDDISGREKRRIVQAGVRKLRSKPGWNPSAYDRSDPNQQLQRLADDTSQARAYIESNECEACRLERAQTADDTALCEKHLMAAAGL